MTVRKLLKVAEQEANSAPDQFNKDSFSCNFCATFCHRALMSEFGSKKNIAVYWTFFKKKSPENSSPKMFIKNSGKKSSKNRGKV